MESDFSKGAARRPSALSIFNACIEKKRLPQKDREARVALLASRAAQGLDLWTGKPLKPAQTEVVPIDEDEE